MRVFILGLFYLGTIINLAEPTHKSGDWTEWKSDFTHLSTVFGNTVFVFIYHHSIPGIIYPVRPQSKVRPMLLTANIIGACLLALEGQLAFWAFGGLTNNCDTFPCTTQPLFNENFQNIIVVG
jgi:amino acid permease